MGRVHARAAVAAFRAAVLACDRGRAGPSTLRRSDSITRTATAGYRDSVVAGTVYPCPCCGYLVLDDGPGRYEICRICRWEDDPGQLRSPWLPDGTNRPSLMAAQRSFAETGVSDPRRRQWATAPPASDARDAGWRPFDVELDGGPDARTESGHWPADRATLYWWRPRYWRALDDRHPAVSPSRDAPHPPPRSNSVNNGL